MLIGGGGSLGRRLALKQAEGQHSDGDHVRRAAARPGRAPERRGGSERTRSFLVVSLVLGLAERMCSGSLLAGMRQRPRRWSER